MPEQARAQLDVDAVGGVREDIGAQAAEHGLEDRDGDQADHQDVERGQTAVHQDLVDHDLEEQRRDQREDLEKERGDQHLAEQAAVFDHGPEEPGDVEPPRQIGQAGAPGEQHEAPVPLGLELAASDDQGLTLERILDQRAAVGDLGKDEESAVAPRRQRRKRRPGEASPVAGEAARLQPERLGAAQHVGNADRRSGREAVADLLGVGADPVEAQEHHEPGQARVGCSTLLDHRRNRGGRTAPRSVTRPPIAVKLPRRAASELRRGADAARTSCRLGSLAARVEDRVLAPGSLTPKPAMACTSCATPGSV